MFEVIPWRAEVVFVKMHKKLMSATHLLFWWGIGGFHRPGELENFINPYMANYVGIWGSMM